MSKTIEAYELERTDWFAALGTVYDPMKDTQHPNKRKREDVETVEPPKKKARQPQYRNFTFTRNNYVNTDFEDAVECTYIIYGKEIGEKEGTPHLQGFVCFKNPRSHKSARDTFIGCHVEIKYAKSTFEQAITYCKKGGDFTERGVPPMDQKEKGEASKQRAANIINLTRAGDFDGLIEQYPTFIISNPGNYEKLQNVLVKQSLRREELDGELEGVWYYGAPGVGKSKRARDEHGRTNVYVKDPSTKWWCNYRGQTVVLLDDFDRRHVKYLYQVKTWSDRYPFPAETKNGNLGDIRPEKLVVTSNYHPSDIWPDDIELAPLLRRFKIVLVE